MGWLSLFLFLGTSDWELGAPAFFSYRIPFPTERGQGDREPNDTAASPLIWG